MNVTQSILALNSKLPKFEIAKSNYKSNTSKTYFPRRCCIK